MTTFKRSAVLLLMMLGLASPAFADTPRLMLIGAMAADQITTAWSLSQPGHYEKNPLYRWAENDPTKVVAAGTALDVVGLYAWTKFTKGKHPAIYKTGLYAMTAWRGYLAAKNARLAMHRHRR